MVAAPGARHKDWTEEAVTKTGHSPEKEGPSDTGYNMMDLRTLCTGGVQSQEGGRCECAAARLLAAAVWAVGMSEAGEGGRQ